MKSIIIHLVLELIMIAGLVGSAATCNDFDELK